MAGKEFKAGGDNKHGWVRALLKKFMGSWGSGPTPDTPPPYTPGEKVINESKTLHHKTPLTSRARIMGVDEYGRVLGYISPAYKAASWFNFQPAKKALILEVPIADRNESISSGSEESSEPFRLRMLNPTKAATAGNFHFLGVQLHLAGSNNEQWKLAACDEGKSGPIFKDRANMLRSAVNTKTEGKGPAGNPASSNVWSIHAVEGDCEELRLSWLDKDSVRFPLRAVSDQTPTEDRASHHFWGRRQTDVNTEGIPIRLIVERF
ncbi:hypothetical protein FRB95_010783 [Tulasnella sp. JGI-2019a]|nr:hypothetical protein FRB95_010783 [Tulasnella sp. JGI-2019a]